MSTITRSEYDTMVSECNGEYPRVLTTDGTDIDHEYQDSYDQWRPHGTIIARMRCRDDFPTFAEANRRRIAVKMGRWTTLSDWDLGRYSAD